MPKTPLPQYLRIENDELNYDHFFLSPSCMITVKEFKNSLMKFAESALPL
jgi:hypothetical protein